MRGSTTRGTLAVGTRTSRLAWWQTRRVMCLLVRHHPAIDVRAVPFTTAGDRNRTTPLQSMNRDDVFTGEIENALRCGQVDVAVHSLKDLPPVDPVDICVGAVPERADVREVLVGQDGRTLYGLRPGAMVGTCSVRRSEQLLALRPDLRILPIRGNVEDRVCRVLAGEFDATILAAAGLQRLGLDGYVTQWLDTTEVMPAPAQAAIAVQCRKDDHEVQSLLASIDDRAIHAAVEAERTLLGIAGGAVSPLGAYATTDANGFITLRARFVSSFGAVSLSVEERGRHPSKLGRRVGEALRDLLVSRYPEAALSRSRELGQLLRRLPTYSPEAVVA